MKLQVNTNGAWKDVIEFDGANMVGVAMLATQLQGMSDKRSRFRMMKDAHSCLHTMDKAGRRHRAD